MENVEHVVTCQGVAFMDLTNCRSWSELPHEPGNWTLTHQLEKVDKQQQKATTYRKWLHFYDSKSVVVSINQVTGMGNSGPGPLRSLLTHMDSGAGFSQTTRWPGGFCAWSWC